MSIILPFLRFKKLPTGKMLTSCDSKKDVITRIHLVVPTQFGISGFISSYHFEGRLGTLQTKSLLYQTNPLEDTGIWPPKKSQNVAGEQANIQTGWVLMGSYQNKRLYIR